MEFGIDTFVTDQSIQPAALARATEERELGVLLLTEHSHIPVKRESPWSGGGELPDRYFRTYDPMVALSAAAAVTSRLVLGTAIALAAQRDVIQFAKEVATLDRVSGGRVLLGVGAGWNKEEARNHGVVPTFRGRVLDEKLAAMKQIWTQEQAEFHGDFVDFDPIFSWPKPVQEPHPPIYVGGESQAAVDRVAAYGDGWLPRVRTSPDELQRVRRRLLDQGKRVGVTLCGMSTDRAHLEKFLASDVDRITFTLPTAPEAEALHALDDVASVIADLV